jgi:superfamily II DNA/RNA helicase
MQYFVCYLHKASTIPSYCSSTSFASGVSFEMQQRAIRSGVHILVATPGRALDHISRGTIDLSNVKHVVLDEVRSSSLS